LSFGSDWSVVTLNPWPAVQMLLTRETPEGTPAGGWIPKERLTLEEAIQGYTMGCAFAPFLGPPAMQVECSLFRLVAIRRYIGGNQETPG